MARYRAEAFNLGQAGLGTGVAALGWPALVIQESRRVNIEGAPNGHTLKASSAPSIRHSHVCVACQTLQRSLRLPFEENQGPAGATYPRCIEKRTNYSDRPCKPSTASSSSNESVEPVLARSRSAPSVPRGAPHPLHLICIEDGAPSPYSRRIPNELQLSQTGLNWWETLMAAFCFGSQRWLK